MKKKTKNIPIVVSNTQWELPESLIRDVQSERMVNSLIEMTTPLSPEESIGWAECVAYFLPELQKKVLRHDVVKIYLYCFTQLQKRKGLLKATPKECIVNELSGYEMKKLNEFKRWLYKSRGGKERNPVVSALNDVFNNQNEKQDKTQMQGVC